MSFDILAPHYRWMEFILAGEKLQRCRTAFLHQIPSAEHILLLGEGHGRGLVACRQRFGNAKITCVDSSKRMLAQARHRLTQSGLDSAQIDFIHADILNWIPPANTYDFIASQFFLDCFRSDQLERLVPQLATSATQNANWLIADFNVPQAGWRRMRSRLILKTMYLFFRTVTRLPAQTLTAPDFYLRDAGFKLHHRAEAEWGLLRSDWWKRDLQ